MHYVFCNLFIALLWIDFSSGALLEFDGNAIQNIFLGHNESNNSVLSTTTLQPFTAGTLLSIKPIATSVSTSKSMNDDASSTKVVPSDNFTHLVSQPNNITLNTETIFPLVTMNPRNKTNSQKTKTYFKNDTNFEESAHANNTLFLAKTLPDTQEIVLPTSKNNISRPEMPATSVLEHSRNSNTTSTLQSSSKLIVNILNTNNSKEDRNIFTEINANTKESSMNSQMFLTQAFSTNIETNTEDAKMTQKVGKPIFKKNQTDTAFTTSNSLFIDHPTPPSKAILATSFKPRDTMIHVNTLIASQELGAKRSEAISTTTLLPTNTSTQQQQESTPISKNRHRKPPGVPTDKTLLLVTKASDTSISSSVSAIAVADERTTSLLPLVLTKVSPSVISSTHLTIYNSVWKREGFGKIIGYLSLFTFVVLLSFCCFCRYRKKRQYGKLRQLEEFYDDDIFFNGKGKKGKYQSDRLRLLDESSEDDLL